MTAVTRAAFDPIAPFYDRMWTNTDIGRLQRSAVWSCTDRLFAAGDHILDLGCGTGEDSVHLLSRGVRVTAIDASPAMVEAARQRGVSATAMSMEQLECLEGQFDGALSNFGALNCVKEFRALRGSMARLIRPGGYLACCFMGRFCMWETAYYLLRGEFRESGRRWRGRSESRSVGISIFYPTVKFVSRAFAPDFELADFSGIGIFVPPSFVPHLPAAVLARCGGIDRKLARWPGFRALSDHRLLIVRRR